MTRFLSFSLLLGCLSFAATARAAEIAPPPREVRKDGTRDPVPQAKATKRENPLETIERIIKNSKEVADKLAKTDTGEDVRKKQDGILKDIRSLLDEDENPPPPKPDMNEDMNKDMNEDMNKGGQKQDMNKGGQKQDMMQTGMNDVPPKKDAPPGGGGGMEPHPMGGSDQPKPRRPRQHGDDPAKQEQQQPKDTGMNPMKNTGGAKDPKNGGGGALPNPRSQGKPPPGMPSIPLEDDAIKQVWGILPDKLRQQSTQYYKPEFMPRYAELLKYYYSSLAEKKTMKK